MTDVVARMHNLRYRNPEMGRMFDASRMEPHRENMEQLKKWYPGLPQEDEYDFAQAFEDGAINMEQIATYQGEPEVGEDGVPVDRPFDYLPPDYWKEDRWGPGHVFPRVRQFELTTGTRQIESTPLRIAGVAGVSVGQGLVEAAADSLPYGRFGNQESLTENVADTLSTPNPIMQTIIAGGQQLANWVFDLDRSVEKTAEELHRNAFGEYSKLKNNSGNGIAGAGEFLATEMIELLGYFALTRKVVPQEMMLKSSKVGLNAGKWKRALNFLSNGLKNSVSPEVLMAEVLYAQNQDNAPGVITAEGLRSIGLEGPLIDALEGADPETQRMIGNMAEGYLFMEALRYAGLSAKAVGHSAYKGVANYISKKTEPLREELAILRRALPTSMTGWHGSPHRFSKFDLANLGTGEGAQAQGHGIYLAQSNTVGNSYRRTTSRAQVARAFLEELPEDADFDDVMEMVGTGRFTSDQEAVIRALEKDDWLGFDYPSQAINQAYKSLDGYDPSDELVTAIDNTGYLYEVDVPDEVFDKLLNLNEPVPDDILRRVAEESIKRGDFEGTVDEAVEAITGGGHDLSGQEFYDALAEQLGSPKAASEFLRDIGIPGAKYRDAFSRTAKALDGDDSAGPSYNMVMYDESLATPVSRNGEPIGHNPDAFRRFGTTGQYSAAPKGIDSPEKLRALYDTVKGLAEEGEVGKEWYEESSRAILDATGGDKELAETLVKILAITSSGTDVKNNTKFALDAIAQHATGQPISTGRFPKAMSKKIQDVLDGKEWSGQKTNSFYINLMEEIDPSKVRGISTQDMWMARAFGYPGDTFSQGSGKAGDEMGSYAFAERMTAQLADELGWEPHQVQAAVWTATKARYEAVAGEVRKLAKEKGIDPKTPEYAALWREVALGSDKITPDVLKKAAYNFKDGLKDQGGQVSFEAIPGRSTGHIPWVHDLPPEARAEYNYRMMGALLDEEGKDILAREFGLPNLGSIHGFGGWDGDVNVSGQTLASMPGTTDGLGEASRAHVEAYAAALGKILRQEGVGYHKDIKPKTLKAANGVDIIIPGQRLDEAQTRALYERVTELTGNPDLAPIPSADGVKFINFADDEGTPFSGIDNKAFRDAVEQAAEETLNSDGIEVVYFTSQGDLLTNDWSKAADGQDYEEIIGRAGLIDAYRRVEPVLRERLGEVETDFERRYGSGQ